MTAAEDFDEYLDREITSAPKELTSNLYHYTSADVAIRWILAERKMRMSPLQGTNDLWESRPFMPNLSGQLEGDDDSGEDIFEVWLAIDRYIRRHSKVACFAQDWELPRSVVNPDIFRGWAHLSMWAHYGDAHRGVCLRFDRERLLAAFKATEAGAVQQFSGAIEYRASMSGVGPHGLDLGQILEFGVDATSLRYAALHKERVYFQKHADWANESEFRLVRTDLGESPHYVDITHALTGVVLGDEFPRERIAELRQLLGGFGEVELQQAVFHSRSFFLAPEVSDEQVGAAPGRESLNKVLKAHRRPGDLSERLLALETAEGTAAEAAALAKPLAEEVVASWERRLLDQSSFHPNWADTKFGLYRRISAIPEAQRGKMPGVPGERVSYESGLLLVGEHQPQYSFTWTMAIAIQVLTEGGVRLHACIGIEESKPDGNARSEEFREVVIVDLENVREGSAEILDRLLAAVPNARAQFDEMRSGAGR